MSASKKSMWWQAGPFEQWVQEVMISVLVPEGASVCELMCGSGKALGKWQRAKLGQYVGVGASPPPPCCFFCFWLLQSDRGAIICSRLCSLTVARLLYRPPGARNQRSQAAVAKSRGLVSGAVLRC